MNMTAGIMVPDRNWAVKLARYSASFSSAKTRRVSSSRPKTRTSACPEKASSTRPFRRPVRAHCSAKLFCERGPTIPMTTPVSGSATRATRASCQEIENIITSTPTTVSRLVIALDRDCCSAWFRLSMSLVTRRSRTAAAG